jgi:hypothetical protein
MFVLGGEGGTKMKSTLYLVPTNFLHQKFKKKKTKQNP